MRRIATVILVAGFGITAAARGDEARAIVDRAIQVHGALGYSTDTPLERLMRNARSARLVDGADEVHLQTIARNTLQWFKEDQNTRKATGSLL